MIDRELLSKFDCIQDLPVSEEMLGAYAEGNLYGQEQTEIKSIISSDSYLHDLVSIPYTEPIFGTDTDIIPEYSLDDISIPNVDNLTECTSLDETFTPLSDEHTMMANCAMGDSILEDSFQRDSGFDTSLEDDGFGLDSSDDNGFDL